MQEQLFIDLLFLSQWIGAIGVSAFYPIQNWRLFLTRNPVGLSFLALSFINVGIAGYLALGLHLKILGLSVGNASNFIFATIILLIIWLRSTYLARNERLAGLAVIATGLSFLVGIHLINFSLGQTISGWMGMLGIILFYPVQNASLFRKKDPAGLSLLAFVSLAIGLLFYTLLGFLVGDLTIVLGNGITFLGTLPIIYMIIRYKKS